MAQPPADNTALVLTAGGILMSTMTAIVVFFIKRYIDANDKHHKSVDEKLGGLKDDLDEHKEKMSEGQIAMTKNVTEIKGIAAGMRENAAKFQSDVNSELLKLYKTSTDLVGNMNTVQKDVKELHEIAKAHQKSLGMGAQALVLQREKLAKLEHTVENIGVDKLLIKKKDPSDKA